MGRELLRVELRRDELVAFGNPRTDLLGRGRRQELKRTKGCAQSIAIRLDGDHVGMPPPSARLAFVGMR